MTSDTLTRARARKQPLILVVDDEVAHYELISELLADAGYATECAGDGREGVARAIELLPDLVLMDIGMPLMDGCTATRTLKQDTRTKHIPIVIMTGFAEPFYRERAKAAGCDGFIGKPRHLDELLALVLEHAPPINRSEGRGG